LGVVFAVLVVFGVLEFEGWGEFCVLLGLVIFFGGGVVFFLFWYLCMVRWEIWACRGLFAVFVFGLVFCWGVRFIFWTHAVWGFLLMAGGVFI
jgi:hypothetical protein